MWRYRPDRLSFILSFASSEMTAIIANARKIVHGGECEKGEHVRD
jgi:hypothetical protein